MRLLIALLSVLAFSNLSLVQASGFCPLADGDAHAPAASASGHHGEHEDHGASPSATSSVDETPGTDSDHPSCLMSGPCGLSADVGVVITAALPGLTDGVSAGSDSAPLSLTTSPAIPPPRA